MVDAHDVDTCSSSSEVVVVQWATALVTRTNGKDNSREREVRETLVRAIHGRARVQGCTTTMAAMVVVQCRLT